MKVELDLSTEQLENLDKSLTDVLLSLTDDQKVKVIQTYLNEKFDKFYEERNNYWGSSKELSGFGKSLLDELQDKIEESVSDKIMENEEIKNILNESIDKIHKNINDIIKNSITSYIINHLFVDKGQLQDIINRNVYDTLNNMNRR